MDAEITIVDREMLEFVIFCVESVAERLGKEPENVYSRATSCLTTSWRSTRPCTPRGRSTSWRTSWT